MKLLTTTTFFSLVAAGASSSTRTDPDQQQQFPDDDVVQTPAVLGTQTTITTSSTFLRRGLMKVEEASSETTEVGGDPPPSSTGTRNKYSRSTKKPLFKPIEPSNVLQYHERLEQQQMQNKPERGAGTTSSAKSLLQNKRTRTQDENPSASRTKSGTRNQDQLVQMERKTSKMASLLNSGKNPLSKLLLDKKKKVDETTSVLLELQRPPVTQAGLEGRRRSAIVNIPKNQRSASRNTVVTSTSRAGAEPAALSHLQKQRRSAISTKTSTQEQQHRKISKHAEHQQGSSAAPTTVKEALESVEFFLSPLRDKLEQEIFKSCTKPYIEEIKRVYQHAVTPIESLAIKKTETQPADPDARSELEEHLEELETRRVSFLSPLFNIDTCAQNLQSDPNCHHITRKKCYSYTFVGVSASQISSVWQTKVVMQRS